jgi:hypothetical protein
VPTDIIATRGRKRCPTSRALRAPAAAAQPEPLHAAGNAVHGEASAVAPLVPKGMRIAAAVAYSGISRPTLYRVTGEGRIRMFKCGRTTLVDVDSLRRFLDALPAASIRPPRKAG